MRREKLSLRERARRNASKFEVTNNNGVLQARQRVEAPGITSDWRPAEPARLPPGRPLSPLGPGNSGGVPGGGFWGGGLRGGRPASPSRGSGARARSRNERSEDRDPFAPPPPVTNEGPRRRRKSIFIYEDEHPQIYSRETSLDDVEPLTPVALTYAGDGERGARKRRKLKFASHAQEIRESRSRAAVEFPDGYQLHEFEPASTIEGGGASGGVWPVDARQNTLHGNQLRNRYQGHGRYTGQGKMRPGEGFDYVLIPRRVPHLR